MALRSHACGVCVVLAAWVCPLCARRDRVALCDPLCSRQVLHVYGTSYQMGVAYGTLMRDEITKLVPQVYEYMDNQIGAWLRLPCLAVLRHPPLLPSPFTWCGPS